LHFEPFSESSAARQAILGSIRLLAATIKEHGTDKALPVALVRHLNEQALTTVILSLKHNWTEQIFDAPDRRRSRRAVADVVELILGDTTAELTVADLAHRAGVGLRALEKWFKADLSCTPAAFIQATRLRKAHEELLRAHPGDDVTVTQVALQWGFNHTGRFASTYRAKYGVPPSVTLRSSFNRPEGTGLPQIATR
jgi:transcriptional regulator GlxA family with amidase domain